MNKPEDELELILHPRPPEVVSIQIPVDVLESLKQVAARRDMSYEALMKFYLGQGLRQDLSWLFADRVFEKTAQVLAQHIQSEEEVSIILQEIQAETVA